MQEDIGDIALQCDLLALNAMIEATRGDADQGFYQQAAKLRGLSQDLVSADKNFAAADKAGNLLLEIESRLEFLTRGQDDISSLAAKITDNSRHVTRALQFEDVVSKLVVYSSDHANSLRSLVAKIEDQNAVIATGIAASQDQIRSMTDAFRSKLEALPDDGREGLICPASQNSLDHADSEMF